ncbi:hypothetical protein HanIR_Chr11g0520371 [Helianthus annuus]|nr:hypothetical protein HanIR_Chr11g0520371 [Helianthus annuus]
MIEVIQMIEQVSCNRFDLKRCIFPYYVYYITCHHSVNTSFIGFQKFDVDTLQGDHVTNVYKGFLESNNSSKWCHKNFINYHVMKMVLILKRTTKKNSTTGISLKIMQNRHAYTFFYIVFDILHVTI